MNKKNSLILLPLGLLLTKSVSAHCPLCTIGVGLVAGGALWLGVSASIIGIFIGAFAVSTGWWMEKLIKKKYVPYQKTLIVLASFLLTVLPLLPLITLAHPVYISLFGDYGSFFNRTYILNISLITSAMGGVVVAISPSLNKKITKLHGKKFIPFQGVFLTLALLIVLAGVVQVTI